MCLPLTRILPGRRTVFPRLPWAAPHMEYARRLVNAGVGTELLVVRGAYHGFDLLVPDAEVSRQFSASWKSALRKAFATGEWEKAEKPKA